MKLEFISFLATDKLELPGLLYSPVKKTGKVLVWLHGASENGVFYNPHVYNPLGKSLAQNGISLLAFNNRGAHHRKYIRIRDENLPEEKRIYTGGTHFETIAECLADIDGAVNFLKTRGYKTFYLGGHSTGANKICVYHAKSKKNIFNKYILSGAGDDSGVYFTQLGEKRFNKALAYAKKAIKSGQPQKVMPKYTGMFDFSAKAAKDIIDPEGSYNTFPFYEATAKRLGKKPLFKEYSQINKPMLVVMGEHDEFAYTGGGSKAVIELLKKHTNKAAKLNSWYEIIKQADHSYHGFEHVHAKLIASWLKG